MFARIVHMRGDGVSVDDADAYARAALLPLFVDAPGALQGYWSSNPIADRHFEITCWADEAALARAMQRDERLLVQAEREIGGVTLDPEVFEVHALFGTSSPATGERLVSRAVWVAGVGHRTKAAALAREIVPTYRSAPGFRSMCWASNATTGVGLGFTVWDAVEDLEANLDHFREARQLAVDSLGIEIASVEVCETVAATGHAMPLEAEGAFAAR